MNQGHHKITQKLQCCLMEELHNNIILEKQSGERVQWLYGRVTEDYNCREIFI